MRNFFFNAFQKTCHFLAGSHIGSYRPAARLYHFLIKRLRPEKVELDGNIFYLDPNDSLAISIFKDYEKAEIDLIKKVLKKGMHVIDLGAHIGYHTVIMSKIIGEKGRVFAFEPNPDHIKLLEKNIKVNKLTNVTIVKKAVGNKNGKITLHLNPENLADHRIYQTEDWKGVDVQITSLDQYFKNMKIPIDFIKMDIQGAEGEAILGMKKLLEKNKKIKILSEFWPEGLNQSPIHAKEYLQVLQKLGFVLRYINEKEDSIEKASIDDILRFSTMDRLKSYINLFLTK